MVVGWSGEDGYGGQDGEEEGERGGEMHSGCCLVFWFLVSGCFFCSCVCNYDVIEEDSDVVSCVKIQAQMDVNV